jgi:dethiobiotin synthetase
MNHLDPRLAQSLFIAGTDTSVGKTHVSVHLLRALTAAGVKAAGMKPVAAGSLVTPDGLRNEDALALQAAGSVPLPYDLINPYCFTRATSPHLAARSAGKIVEIESIKSAFEAIRSKTEVVIVEGAGGWYAPIGDPATSSQAGPTMATVAQALGLPILLVVAIRLGCISHAVLTAQAIKRDGLSLAGWYANAMDPAFADEKEYIESLESRLEAPRLTLP